MIVEKAKRDVAATVTDEQRRRAVRMVKDGSTLREAAAAFGVSHQTVSNWVNSAELERVTFAPARSFERPRKPRKPVYIDGVRLGRLALWS
ncbi:MAG: helix-turn-helix domain-containing protein [Methylocystis silviterrae]